MTLRPVDDQPRRIKIVPIDGEIQAVATEYLPSARSALRPSDHEIYQVQVQGSGEPRRRHMIGRLVASFPSGRGGLSLDQVGTLVEVFDQTRMVLGRIGPDGQRTTDETIRSGSVQWISAGEVGEQLFSHLFTLASVTNREHDWRFDIEGITPLLQGTRYSSDRQEHYSWHMDWGAGPIRIRKIAVVAHLSPEGSFAGGDLELTNGARPVRADQAPGTVTVFPSFLMHRVTPVTRGVRLGIVAWVLGPPFR